MVHSTFYPLGLDSSFTKMIPNIHCQLGCIFVWPVIFVDKRMRVVEVVDEIVLNINVM